MLLSTYNRRDTVSLLERLIKSSPDNEKIVVVASSWQGTQRLALDFLGCRRNVKIDSISQSNHDVHAYLPNGIEFVFAVNTDTQQIRGQRANLIIVDEVQYVDQELLTRIALCLPPLSPH